MGSEGWDAILQATEGLSALESLQGLRARSAEARWAMHRPAFHEHPLAFSDRLLRHGCDGGRALQGWGGCVGFEECGLGFRCTAGCNWDSCLACAAQTDAFAS